MANNTKGNKRISSVKKSKYGVQVNYSDGTGYWSEKPASVNVDEVIREAKRRMNEPVIQHGATSNTTKRAVQKKK